MLFGHLSVYFLAFLLIWSGAGLVVSAIDRFSGRLKLSSFAVSFIVLGLATSIPEFAVGLTALAEKDPQIFVGNLLGGIPVIFLFIIPLLAILGNGIRIKHEFDSKKLLATLLVILAPSILLLDSTLTNLEGVFLVLIYLILLFFIQKNHGIFDSTRPEILQVKAYSIKDIISIFIGIAAVFIASKLIVDKTILLSGVFNIPEFYISLVILSLGTNLPELSLAIRSVVLGKKDIAFGDYMGSAAANTVLLGIFTIFNEGAVSVGNSYMGIFLTILIGLSLFYFFTRLTNGISRKEGFVLLAVYFFFVIFEFIS